MTDIEDAETLTKAGDIMARELAPKPVGKVYGSGSVGTAEDLNVVKSIRATADMLLAKAAREWPTYSEEQVSALREQLKESAKQIEALKRQTQISPGFYSTPMGSAKAARESDPFEAAAREWYKGSHYGTNANPLERQLAAALRDSFGPWREALEKIEAGAPCAEVTHGPAHWMQGVARRALNGGKPDGP